MALFDHVLPQKIVAPTIFTRSTWSLSFRHSAFAGGPHQRPATRWYPLVMFALASTHDTTRYIYHEPFTEIGEDCVHQLRL